MLTIVAVLGLVTGAALQLSTDLIDPADEVDIRIARGRRAPGAGDAATSSTEPLIIGALRAQYPGLEELAWSPEALEAAVSDVNEAGGVLGRPLELTVVDLDEISGDTRLAKAREAGRRLIEAGVDVFIGPRLESAIEIAAAEVLAEAGVMSVSPRFPIAALDEYQPHVASMYAPPELDGIALGRALKEEGVERLAILRSAGMQGVDHGLPDGLEAANVEVVADLEYTFDDLVDDGGLWVVPEDSDLPAQAAAADPDAVLLIGVLDANGVVEQLVQKGVERSQVWSADEWFSTSDPPEGVRVVARADRWDLWHSGLELPPGAQWLLSRSEPPDRGPLGPLTDADIENYETLRGAREYDAVIVSALAATAASSTDGPDIASALSSVTGSEGEQCFVPGDCLDLLRQGRRITYVGHGGPVLLAANNRATGATYAVRQADDGTFQTTRTFEVTFD